MARISLFIHWPAGPTLSKALPELEATGLFSIHMVKIDSDLLPVLVASRPCVCIFSIQDSNTGRQVCSILHKLKDQRIERKHPKRDPSFRTVLVVEDQSIPLERWQPIGLHELVFSPISPKGLTHKIVKHYHKSFCEEVTKNDQGYSFKKIAPSIKPAKEVKFIKKPGSKKEKIYKQPAEESQTSEEPVEQLQKISVRAKLPMARPGEGEWNLLPAEKGFDDEWVWTPNNKALAEKNKGQEYRFSGDKPRALDRSGSWLFEGDQPKLLVYKNEKPDRVLISYNSATTTLTDHGQADVESEEVSAKYFDIEKSARRFEVFSKESGTPVNNASVEGGIASGESPVMFLENWQVKSKVKDSTSVQNIIEPDKIVEENKSTLSDKSSSEDTKTSWNKKESESESLSRGQWTIPNLDEQAPVQVGDIKSEESSIALETGGVIEGQESALLEERHNVVPADERNVRPMNVVSDSKQESIQVQSKEAVDSPEDEAQVVQSKLQIQPEEPPIAVTSSKELKPSENLNNPKVVEKSTTEKNNLKAKISEGSRENNKMEPSENSQRNNFRIVGDGSAGKELSIKTQRASNDGLSKSFGEAPANDMSVRINSGKKQDVGWSSENLDENLAKKKEKKANDVESVSDAQPQNIDANKKLKKETLEENSVNTGSEREISWSAEDQKEEKPYGIFDRILKSIISYFRD